MRKSQKFMFQLLTLSFLVLPQMVFAGLSKDYIQSINMQIYGLYTSDQADCSNLIPTCPLSGVAQPIDFLAGQQTLCANARVPSGTVRCMAIVMKNTVSVTYKSAGAAGVGSYTSTSGGLSDSVCNAGGTATFKPCGMGGSQSVYANARMTADFLTAGLTPTTTCSASPTGNEVVTIYLSTNAACTGNRDIDGTTCSSWNSFYPPSSSGDTTKGIRITAKAGNSFTAFKVTPEGVIGNSGGTCTSVAPPLFGYDSGSSRSAVSQSYSAPTLVSVSPVAGAAGSSTTLTVTGVGLDPCGAVGGLVNSSTGAVALCTNASVSGTCNPNAAPSGTSLTCYANSVGGGSNVVANLKVANLRAPAAVGTLNSVYEYRQAPTVTSITPTQFRNGTDPSPTLVTITGTGFRVAGTVGASDGTISTNSARGSNFEISFLDSSGTRSHHCRDVTIANSGTTAYCLVTWPGSARTTKIVVTNQPDGQTYTGTSPWSATGLLFQ